MLVKKLFFFSQEIIGNSFWSLIVGQRWQATLVCGKETFAPLFLNLLEVVLGDNVSLIILSQFLEVL